VPFLVPGRFIKITHDPNHGIERRSGDIVNWGWGIVVNFQKMKINPKKFVMGDTKNKDHLDVITKSESHYIVDVLLYVNNKLTADNVLQPGDFSKKDGRLGVIPVILHHSSVAAISTIQMNLPSHNLTSPENMKQVEMFYNEIMKRFDNGNKLPLLDPIEDMEIEEKHLTDLIKTKE
jgi:ATP-dependent RNA helicase DOB1